jgi:ADP-ribose pyrophosphatase YjhB (NUDIX family)
MLIVPRFCCQCGSASLDRRLPPGDDHPRLVCLSCGYVHYENPKIITGCIIEHAGRYLLCKRAIPPRIGTWTLPAGFMENGETAEDAALREVREESGILAEILCPYSLFSVPTISELYLIFRATMIEDTGNFGPETLECRFFAPEEIPWELIYYPAIRQILERYIQERDKGHYGLYVGNDATGRVHFVQ